MGVKWNIAVQAFWRTTINSRILRHAHPRTTVTISFHSEFHSLSIWHLVFNIDIISLESIGENTYSWTYECLGSLVCISNTGEFNEIIQFSSGVIIGIRPARIQIAQLECNAHAVAHRHQFLWSRNREGDNCALTATESVFIHQLIKQSTGVSPFTSKDLIWHWSGCWVILASPYCGYNCNNYICSRSLGHNHFTHWSTNKWIWIHTTRFGGCHTSVYFWSTPTIYGDSYYIYQDVDTNGRT